MAWPLCITTCSPRRGPEYTHKVSADSGGQALLYMLNYPDTLSLALDTVCCLLVHSSAQLCVVGMVQEAEDKPEQPKATEKPAFEDDFFDSISSDATGRSVERH